MSQIETLFLKSTLFTAREHIPFTLSHNDTLWLAF